LIIGQDLNTAQKDTLLKSVDHYPLTPLFLTQDEKFLIYSEPSSIYYPDILSIKSLELANPQNNRVLAGGLSIIPTGMIKSHNDKTAFSSDGQIYVLDLNTSELTPIASGEFASISNNGEKVVFTTGFELFIINLDGSNFQKIVSKTSEKKYLFLPFFSIDDEQVVFVESNYPRYY
jgi:Tol biopolymer transport system component